MANKRVLDLAKDLGVTADDVQRAAQGCGVAVSGPTSNLDSDDVGKLTTALTSKEGKKAGGSKTLTLGKPLSTSGAKGHEGGSHSVEVSVRRRRGRVSQAGKPTTALPSASKPSLKPAQQAEQAMKKAEATKAPVVRQPKVAVQTPATTKKPVATKAPVTTKPAVKPQVKKPVVSKKTVVKREGGKGDVAPTSGKSLPKPAVSPAKLAAEKMVALKEKKTEEQAAQRKKRREARTQRNIEQRSRTTTSNSNQQRSRQDSLPTRAPAARVEREKRAPKPKTGGPRTTIRAGLTPAQIAASKAPRSSIKQIEAKITKDRRSQRQNTRGGQGRPNQQARPGSATAPSSVGMRRTPSVAVGPVEPAVAPTGQKRRPVQGRHQKRRLSPAEKAARRDYSSKRHQSLTP